MEHKNISFQSAKLLKQLFGKDKLFFTPGDASSVLTESKPSAVRELLRSMAERGLIMRIKGGLYNIIPYDQDSTKYFPNWHLTAAAIAQPKEYYIGFYSALDIHGLITQPSLVEQVVTHERIEPKKQKLKNVRIEFITFNKEHFFGYKKQWIDDFNKVNCSDLEKTFIDCLFKPQYAGGITEIAKAIYKSRDQIRPEKFMEYLIKFDAQVVFKRLGFILDHLQLYEELRNFILSKISKSFAPLDTSSSKEGKHHSKWCIIDNVGIESVIKSLQT